MLSDLLFLCYNIKLSSNICENYYFLSLFSLFVKHSSLIWPTVVIGELHSTLSMPHWFLRWLTWCLNSVEGLGDLFSPSEPHLSVNIRFKSQCIVPNTFASVKKQFIRCTV